MAGGVAAVAAALGMAQKIDGGGIVAAAVLLLRLLVALLGAVGVGRGGGRRFDAAGNRRAARCRRGGARCAVLTLELLDAGVQAFQLVLEPGYLDA